MLKFIEALFGLGQVGVNKYMDARARFFKTVVALVLLLVFQWMMNYWGFTLINIFIFFGLYIATLIMWTRPEVVTLMVALEATRAKTPEAATTPQDTNYFTLYLAYILLWMSIISMFVITLPFGWYLSFKEAFVVTFIGLMFLSVIAWTSFFKWTKITVYKKVISTYAIVGFLICVWILVPSSIKMYAFGTDFYGSVGTSAKARAYSKSNRKVMQVTDEVKAARIMLIGDEIANCRGQKECLDKISDEDLKFWLKIKDDLSKETIPSKFIDGLSQISWPTFGKSAEAAKPAAPAPAAAPAPQQIIVVAAPAAQAPAPTANTGLSGRWTVCVGPDSALKCADGKIESDKFDSEVIVFNFKSLSEISSSWGNGSLNWIDKGFAVGTIGGKKLKFAKLI